MKKRILIVLPTLHYGGGIISGLKNMLSSLDTESFEIHVLPLGYSGDNNVELKNCKVLKDSFILSTTDGVYEHCGNYRYKRLLWICKAFLAFLYRIKLRNAIVSYLYKKVARNYNGYDVVVAYQEGATTSFVQYINTPFRIAWIHCDYARYYELCHCSSEELIYKKYNKIVCVSKYTLNNFINVYPSLKERSTYVYNLLDVNTIKYLSNQPNDEISFDENVVNIVSIGRMDRVKQFHLIPRIISQILNRGIIKFRWILIGGGDPNIIREIGQEIEKNGISEKHFKYIGPQFNPFPYIKSSDILVSTSLSEACPFVVSEARVLGVPVVSNNYPSIFEFIDSGSNGMICSIDEMPEVLSELISNRDALNTLKLGVSLAGYNNDEILEEICSLLNASK